MQTIEKVILEIITVGLSFRPSPGLNGAQPPKPRCRLRRHGTLSIFAVAFVLVVAASTVHAQHTVRLPQPTGPYQIGTTSFALVDETRPEAFTDDPKDHRELLVRGWYPAQSVAGANPEPFWGKDTKEIGSLLAQFMRLPKTAFDDLALVQSHAYTDAPLSKSRSPILCSFFRTDTFRVFSPKTLRRWKS